MPWSAVTSSRLPSGSRSAIDRASWSTWVSWNRHGSEPGPYTWPSRSRSPWYAYRNVRSDSGSPVTAAARSPSARTPQCSPPRSTARVSPLPRNAPGTVIRTATPCAASRSNAVGTGCTSSGTNRLRRSRGRPAPWVAQPSVLIATPSPTSKASPTTPCPPGGRPVPMLARLVAVVDGKPAVIRWPGRVDRNGASAANRRSRCRPSPSTSSRTTCRASGRPSTELPPGTPSASSTPGVRSDSAPAP